GVCIKVRATTTMTRLSSTAPKILSIVFMGQTSFL
ncbi:MAG: hypothetical protein ACI9HA_002310, partial [Dinoroseobacter sp.]